MDLNEKIQYANQLFRDKRYEDALRLYIEITDEAPGEAVYYNNIASILFAMNRYEQALQYYLKAKDKGFKNAEMFCSMGACYEKLADTQHALFSYSGAIMCSQDSGKSYYLRGQVHRKLGDLARSAADFDMAVTYNYYG
jgi:tetratricopeptide (TPR) repeat protein